MVALVQGLQQRIEEHIPLRASCQLEREVQLSI
jgi:hypothetical protein